MTAPYRIFAGSYDVGQGGAIHSLSLDKGRNQLSRISTLWMPDPTYLALSATGAQVLAASEVDAFEGTSGGGVTSLDIVHDGLVSRASQPTFGAWTCFVTTTPDGTVLAANYLAGTVSVLSADLDPLMTISLAEHPKVHSGTRPFVHCVVQRPGYDTVFIVASGLDEVIEASLDERDVWVATALQLPQGSRPRHLTFSRDGSTAYLVTEATSKLYVLTATPGDSRALRVSQEFSTIPVDFRGQSVAAAVRLSPDERTLIVTNRGHDSVAVFRRDPLTGKLTHTHTQSVNDGRDVSGPLTDNMPISGSFPRDAAFSTDGLVLAVALQRAGEVVLLEHLEHGRVSPPIARVDVPGAATVAFARLS